MELKGLVQETLENLKKSKFEKNKSLVFKMSREIMSDGTLKLNDSKTIAEVDVALDPVLREIEKNSAWERPEPDFSGWQTPDKTGGSNKPGGPKF